MLLDGSQCLGRCGIAPQDDEMTPHFEKFDYRLPREFVHHIERTRSIRRTRVVAQIHIIVFGQQLTDAMKDGQSAITGVEHPDGAWRLRQLSHRVAAAITSLLVPRGSPLRH